MRKFTPYTLIEIMIVMALAAILVTLALPAFSALMRGNSVGITCGMIKNTMDQAQARAITDRKYVATVFDLTGDVSGLRDMQAMRNCYVSATSPYTFQGWVEESQWVKLDQDAQILAQNAGGTGTDTDSDFLTNGGNNPDMHTLQNISSVRDASSSNLPGVVYSTYGNICAPNSNFYFGVGEATLANENYIFKNPNPNGRSGNVMALKVNHFTGRSQIAAINEEGIIE